MNYWKAAIFFFAAFLIQPSLLNMISIEGYTPNLLLCLVVIFSFIYEDKAYGMIFGAVFGALYELCYSNVIGPMAISLVLVSLLVMQTRSFANVENIINMLIVSALSFAAYYLLNWLLRVVAGTAESLAVVLSYAPWVIVYTMAVTTIVYAVLIRKAAKHRRDRYLR